MNEKQKIKKKIRKSFEVIKSFLTSYFLVKVFHFSHLPFLIHKHIFLIKLFNTKTTDIHNSFVLYKFAKLNRIFRKGDKFNPKTLFCC